MYNKKFQYVQMISSFFSKASALEMFQNLKDLNPWEMQRILKEFSEASLEFAKYLTYRQPLEEPAKFSETSSEPLRNLSGT